jgi:inhibitor of cysteine peptidase
MKDGRRALQIGPEHQGRRIALARGEALELSLPENPTTGYRWTLAEVGPWRVDGDRNAPPSTPLPGAASVRHLRIVPTAPGLHRLRLRCMRAWEGESGAIQQFDIEVDVG